MTAFVCLVWNTLHGNCMGRVLKFNLEINRAKIPPVWDPMADQVWKNSVSPCSLDRLRRRWHAMLGSQLLLWKAKNEDFCASHLGSAQGEAAAVCGGLCLLPLATSPLRCCSVAVWKALTGACRQLSFLLSSFPLPNVKVTTGILITFNGTWHSLSGGGANLQKVTLQICW